MKRMSAEQALSTIELLQEQTKNLRKNSSKGCAEQNERIINRLKRRVKSGKYPKQGE